MNRQASDGRHQTAPQGQAHTLTPRFGRGSHLVFNPDHRIQISGYEYHWPGIWISGCPDHSQRVRTGSTVRCSHCQFLQRSHFFLVQVSEFLSVDSHEWTNLMIRIMLSLQSHRFESIFAKAGCDRWRTLQNSGQKANGRCCGFPGLQLSRRQMH